MKFTIEDKEKIGMRIAIIRRSLGLTGEEFAQLIDKKASKSSVAAWESGRNLPNAQRLKIIAELGNITVEQLLKSKDYELNALGMALDGIDYEMVRKDIEKYRPSIEKFLNNATENELTAMTSLIYENLTKDIISIIFLQLSLLINNVNLKE